MERRSHRCQHRTRISRLGMQPSIRTAQILLRTSLPRQSREDDRGGLASNAVPERPPTSAPGIQPKKTSELPEAICAGDSPSPSIIDESSRTPVSVPNASKAWSATMTTVANMANGGAASGNKFHHSVHGIYIRLLKSTNRRDDANKIVLLRRNRRDSICSTWCLLHLHRDTRGHASAGRLLGGGD